MNAILKVQEFYERKGFPRPFVHDLQAHLLHGYVVCQPDLFAMARPVHTLAPDAALADPAHDFRDPNCWLVWAAAATEGRKLPELFALLPFHLPFLMFHRAGRGLRRHVYEIEKLEDKAWALCAGI